VIKFQKGLSINTIKAISAYKQEDHFFLNLRLNAYKTFLKLKNPKRGPDLSLIDFSSYIYFSILSNDQKK
jgi:Fe-S cluster assembly protein SufB